MKTIVLSILLVVGIALPASAQRLELGTTTAICPEASIEQLRAVKEAGIEWVEVALNKFWRGVPKAEVMPRIDALKVSLDSVGLKVWSIHLPFSRTLDISVINDTLRRSNVKLIAKMIRKSAIFNPQRLVLHPSSEPIADSMREARILSTIASIRELKGLSDELGLELCIENLPRTCLGNTPEELMHIAEAADVNICFDTNHYFQGTTEHFLAVAGSRIRTLHCSDYDYANECHWLPTQGDIKWGELMLWLDNHNYDGVFMYEAMKSRNDGSRLTPQQLVLSFETIKREFENLKKLN